MNEIISVHGFPETHAAHLFLFANFPPGIPRRKYHPSLQVAHPDPLAFGWNLWSTLLKCLFMGPPLTIQIRPQVWHSGDLHSLRRRRTWAKGSLKTCPRSPQPTKGITTNCPRIRLTAPDLERRFQGHEAQHRTSSLGTRSQGCWVPAHSAESHLVTRARTTHSCQLSALSRAELGLHLGLRPRRVEEVRDNKNGLPQLTTALSRTPPSWFQPAREYRARRTSGNWSLWRKWSQERACYWAGIGSWFPVAANSTRNSV